MGKFRVGLLAAALVLSGPLTLMAMAEKITIDQVPPAVRATIEREAAGNKITEVERGVKDGKTVFQAEWMDGKREVEIKVDSNGKLLPSETDDKVKTP